MKEEYLAILQPMVCQPAPPKTHRLEIVLDCYSSHLWNEMMLPQKHNLTEQNAPKHAQGL